MTSGPGPPLLLDLCSSRATAALATYSLSKLGASGCALGYLMVLAMLGSRIGVGSRAGAGSATVLLERERPLGVPISNRTGAAPGGGGGGGGAVLTTTGSSTGRLSFSFIYSANSAMLMPIRSSVFPSW